MVAFILYGMLLIPTIAAFQADKRLDEIDNKIQLINTTLIHYDKTHSNNSIEHIINQKLQIEILLKDGKE